ncbi:hypothetical protein GPJ56_005083 [Histomonas meleagridis]|uniref:uncharacterized protein n=1 Tax=Histomonas meleagridis TaxID=135588 RepID=UPI00355942F4|nr:hypothetical protein GPJ56_005083 [Histomonas meleagridis]KAH0802600.1 hypothetical protein GO595_004649 [Histomonas meleagridis]
MSIKFPNSEDNFIIILQNNFPISPPSVTSNGAAISIPIIRYWQSVFTISDILSQLSCYASINKPQPFQPNPTEIQSSIQSFPPSKIATPEGRLEFLSSLPTYSNAINAKRSSEGNANNLKNKVKTAASGISQKSSLLTQSISTKQQLEVQLTQSKQAIAAQINQSKNNKIAELKNENARVDAKIQELQSKLSSKAINMDQFLVEYNKLKQQQAYNNTITKLLSQRQDFF